MTPAPQRCDSCSFPVEPGEAYCSRCGGVIASTVITAAEEPDRTAAFLLVELPDATVRREGLFDQALKVGRADSCDIVIDHPRVSRVHATIENRDGEWWITDQRSSGGTFVNGKPIHEATVLRSGDTCRLGRHPNDSVTIVFHDKSLEE